jgi:hypothetical protein
MMRIWIFAVLAFIAVLLAILFDPAAPSFHPGRTPVNKSVLALDYPFLNAIPFPDGLTWVHLTTGTNVGSCWILNVAEGKVLGELTGLDPLFIDGKTKQVFGKRLQPTSSRISHLFALARAYLRLPARPELQDEFWLVDLTDRKRARFATSAKWDQSYTGVSSPDQQKVYQMRMPAIPPTVPVVVYNLKTLSISSNTVPGWAYGWWSNTEIIYKGATGFALFDIDHGVSNPLLAKEDLREWLKSKAVDQQEIDSQAFGAFPVWDGHDYQFYIADLHTKWSAQPGYLARIDKQTKELKMISTDFQFGWSDHFDSTGRFYAYSGRESGQQSSAVFLRDLQKGTERVLVPEDKAYFSIPHFYNDSIVFIRSNVLWRIDLTGANLLRLVPPE